MTLDDINEKLYLYNPKSPESIQALIDTYPEFSENLDKLEKHKNKVAKFIIIFYDMNSDLRGLIPDFWNRKKICAELVGFKVNENGVFPKDIKEFLIGENENVNAMIVRYLLLFNNPDYVELEVATDMYNKQARQALKQKIGATPGTIKDINKNLTDLNKKIKETTESVFGGKESSKLEEMLYAFMQRERLKLRPEDIAINSGKDSELDEVDIYGVFQ
jgi:ATP-dependent protease Clp ATPase subunit